MLAITLLLAAALRLVGISHLPPGFTPDEAAFGYNAYSLLNTGHDEWGIPFWQVPATNLRSFGDYKLPLYAFLSVPSVAIFGLNEFSTRLPNAILGTLSVISVYLLSQRLFGSPEVGKFGAFLMAISPWSVQLSRGAFEANLVTFFLPLALYLLLINSYKLSALFFAMNFYSYHSGRFLTPSVVMISIVIFKPKFKIIFLHLLLLLLLISPGLFSLIGSGSTRVSDVGIFNSSDGWAAMATRRLELINSGTHPFVARLLANKPQYLTMDFLHQYRQYFSHRFWFGTGPAEGTYGMLIGQSTVYPVLAIALIGFLVALPRSKPSWFLLVLLLLSAIPPALAKGPGFAANRAAGMLPWQSLVLSVGMSRLSKKIFVGVIILLIISAGVFVNFYKTTGTKLLAHPMLYGMRETFKNASSLRGQIAVSRSLSEPHIFLAFYSEMDPRIYQKYSPNWLIFEKIGFKFLDQYDGYRLDRFRFGDLINAVSQNPDYLIGRPAEVFPGYTQAKTVNYPDGLPSIVISRKTP